MHDLYDIERVVPHRDTLRLVDRLVAWDEDSVAVELRVPHEGPFSHAEGVPAWVGVEYMAQAIAAWAGCRARSAGREPSIGFLLGTRRYESRVTWFVAGALLRVEAMRELLGDNGLGMFRCRILEDGETARGSTEFIVLRGKRVTPEYVYCLARTHDFRGNAIKSMVGSSGRQRVQESCFEKFLVLVPTDTLLDLFTDYVRPHFRQIKTLHAQSQKLRAARDLLLPRLMNGEIAI